MSARVDALVFVALHYSIPHRAAISKDRDDETAIGDDCFPVAVAYIDTLWEPCTCADLIAQRNIPTRLFTCARTLLSCVSLCDIDILMYYPCDA